MQNKMRSKMVRFGLSLAPVFLWAASTQAAPRSVYFWNSSAGTEGARVGMDLARLGVWGNGEFSDARNVKYEGADTLKITTRNFREGVRFDLKSPLDISAYQETGYLRFRLRFREVGGRATGRGGKPGAPQPPAGGFGGEAGAGGFGEPDTLGGALMTQTSAVRANAQLGPLPPLGEIGGLPPGLNGENAAVASGPPSQETPITQILCTLILDNGIMEGKIDVPKSWENPRRIDFDKVRPDSKGWLLFSLKMKDMRSTPNASGLVRRMILSADKQDSFYLTQAALVVETGEMTVAIRRMSDAPGTEAAEITIPPGLVNFVADVEAGAADPAIEWNFDADNVGNLPRVNLDGNRPAPRGGGGKRPAKPPVLVGEDGETPEVEEVPAGPRIDARGLIAKFTYPDEEQNYRIEVTVRDRAGKKEPVTSSIIVRVRG